MYDWQRVLSHFQSFVVELHNLSSILDLFDLIRSDRAAKHRPHATRKMHGVEHTRAANLAARIHVNVIQLLLLDSRRQICDRLECGSQPGVRKLFILLDYLLLRVLISNRIWTLHRLRTTHCRCRRRGRCSLLKHRLRR